MYTIKATTNEIWWNRGNDNKPNSTIINGIHWNIDIDGINFLNLDNGTFASERDDITFLKIETKRLTYYYFVASINRIASNDLFVYDIILDSYSTYFLPFFKNNMSKNFLLTRTHEFNMSCLSFKDDLLESLPKTTQDWKYVFNAAISEWNESYVRYYKIFKQGATRQNIGIEILDDNKTMTINWVLYYAFRRDNKLWIYPILAVRAGNPSHIRCFNGFSYRDHLDNTLDNLNNIRKSQEWANSFIGMFLGPNVLQIYDAIDEGTFTAGGVRYNLAYIKNQVLTSIRIDEFIISSIYQTTAHPYYFKYYEPHYYLRPLNIDLIMKPIDNINNAYHIAVTGYLSFSQGFIFNITDTPLYSNNQAWILNIINDGIINFGNNLPIMEDEFLKYIQANISSINTGFSVQQQQLNFQKTDAFASGIYGAGTSMLKSGGINKALGAVNSIGGSLKSIKAAQLNFNNMKDLAISKYSDMKNSTPPSIQMSSTIDVANLSFYLGYGTQTYGFFIKNLTEDTRRAMDFIVKYYGYTLYHYQVIGDYYNKFIHSQGYVYIICDAIFIDNNPDIIWNGFLPSEIELIKSMCKNGVRIWNISPR